MAQLEASKGIKDDILGTNKEMEEKVVWTPTKLMLQQLLLGQEIA